jgi:methionine-gamma-lyase
MPAKTTAPVVRLNRDNNLVRSTEARDPKPDYRSRTIGNHTLHPETQMMRYGYSPELSEGAVKSPVFLTSTFVFRSAEEGRALFDLTAGRCKPRQGDESSLVYSRLNNPNFEMLEDRVALYEGAETTCVFASGMGAISTLFWAFLRPGNVVLHSTPLYGGTETLIANTLTEYGIVPVSCADGTDRGAVMAAADEAMAKGPVSLIFAETPANPTNSLVDLGLFAEAADRIEAAQGKRPVLAVDNTLLGPLYQKPLACGADVVVYSLTKYVGGHSDLIAGGAAGSHRTIDGMRRMRGALGTQLDAHSCWMLLRSLETLSLRMEKASRNADTVARFLAEHPAVTAVNHLGLIDETDPRHAVYRRQCTGSGSTFSFTVLGGERAAFDLLNNLQIIKLAVSLGGTESLACHPASTTHSGIDEETRQALGIAPGLVRLSVGIEHPDDLIADLAQALATL